MSISQKAIDLIIAFEGLNQPYAWPGGSSGITIGYGYDLGYCTEDEFAHDWGLLLGSDEYMDRLKTAVGVKGINAQAIAPRFRDIHISKAGSERVFAKYTLPKYEVIARHAFPGMIDLPLDAQGALVSLVINRGGSINPNDPRRAEMAKIHDIIADGVQNGDLQAIADQIRAMKRLWEGKGLDGLLRRRELEAKLVESCIEKPLDVTAESAPEVRPDYVQVPRGALAQLRADLSTIAAMAQAVADSVKEWEGNAG